MVGFGKVAIAKSQFTGFVALVKSPCGANATNRQKKIGRGSPPFWLSFCGEAQSWFSRTMPENGLVYLASGPKQFVFHFPPGGALAPRHPPELSTPDLPVFAAYSRL